MKKKILIIFFLNFFFTGILYANVENKIIAKVGKEIITSLDIKNKILSTLIVANNEINQSNIDKIKAISLENLINSKLKISELRNYKIEIDERRINEYLNNISNNDINGLMKKFDNYNLDFELFKKDVEVEIKWRQLIYQKYSKKIDINESSINDEINKIINNKLMNKEVNLSEIQVLKNNNSEKKIISDISNEIKENGFENTALKFSISNTSSKKGDLGWINTKTLSKRIFNIINKMKINEVSKPIIQSDTILFLKLNDERNVSITNLDKKKLRNNILIKKKNEIFNLYSISHLSVTKNKYLVEYK